MKKVLNKFGAEPFIIHLPGDGMKDFYHYISFLEDKPITYNENIHVVFICTPDIDSPLERQLIKNNIPYTNILSFIQKDYLKISKKWNWMYKHIAMQRFLNDWETLESKNISKTTYFIVLDASDIIINHLDNIVDTYKKNYKNKIVFCGTKSEYPNEYFFDKNYKQTPTHKANFCVYINNGCYLANYHYLNKLTELILQCNSTGLCGDYKLLPHLINDDQYICKVIMEKQILGYNTMYVDDYCVFFQSASACTIINETEDAVIID